MKTNGVVQAAALSGGAVKALLREGSSVFVRILKNNGNNSYTAAFGGGRFNIKSELPLKPGMSFLAGIRFQDGKLVLMQQNSALTVEGSALQRLGAAVDSAGALVNPALIQYFKKLALPPDDVSLSLYNQMKAAGLRFEKAAFDKARMAAEKSGMGQKAGAAASFVLGSKSLPSDGRAVRALLGDSGDGETSRHPEARDARSALANAEQSTDDFSEGEAEPFKSFFTRILKGDEAAGSVVPLDAVQALQNQDAVSAGAFGAKPGLLTLFNHLGFDFASFTRTGNWIRVPFDFSYKKNGIKSGTGVFCALLNARYAERFLVRFCFEKEWYGFAADTAAPDGRKPVRITLANGSGSTALEDVARLVQERFPSAEVLLCPAADFTDFFCAPQKIETVNGVV